MIELRIEDMTCGHCASRISAAIKAIDASARCEIDLRQKLARIESAEAEAQLVDAIREAGYSPVVSARA